MKSRLVSLLCCQLKSQSMFGGCRVVSGVAMLTNMSVFDESSFSVYHLHIYFMLHTELMIA